MNERATHFQGFANVVMDDVYNITIEHLHTYGLHYSQDELIIKQRQIIAQHAYDLVKHTLLHTAHIDLDRLETDEHVARIPDLTE